MKTNHKKERGQALILIVFGIVGMIGLTGLAIDGGNAYSDRRHAQNAADTASMAAALARINGTDWVAAGQSIAAANGYPAAGPNSTVVVTTCDMTPQDPPCVLAPGETAPEDYVHVVVTSTFRTYFAPVLGIRQMTNKVQAIARAVPSVPTPWYNGNALVALMPGCKPSGWPNDPFTVGGNSHATVNGAGIFVNSTCSDAFTDGGNSNVLDSPGGICVVGGDGSGTSGITPPPETDCGTPMDPAKYKLPPLGPTSCDTEDALPNAGTITTEAGKKFANPGTYSGTFPPGSGTDLYIRQGIYCLENGISVQGSWNLTTDLNGNGSYESTEGALFYIPSGDVSISGGSSIYLHAITTTSSGLDPDLTGYLIYMPPTNSESIQLGGGSDNTYIGTILAPSSLVQLDGGSSGESLNLQTQIVGYSIVLTGSGQLNITYDQSLNATTYTNPQLTPYK